MTLLKKMKAAIKPLSFSPEQRSCQLVNLGTVTYILKRSTKRQTLSLQVRSGNIIINAPSYLALNDIEAFLTAKADWLQTVLTKQAERPNNQLDYRHGSKLMLLGEWVRLELAVSRTTDIQYDQTNKQILFCSATKNLVNRTYIRRKLQAFIKQLAIELISPRVKYWTEKTGYQPSALQFKFYKSRWGCCYQSGEVRINPLIIGAPWSVIDCVIIHELCHLQHLNHSQAFWELNHQHCGQCDAGKNWLRHYHDVLQLPAIGSH